MLRTPAPETPAIDRSACPSRGGHGTRHHRYANGCTCPDGLADLNRYRRLYTCGVIASSLVDALGTRRRLQALAVLGYSTPWLARYIGTTHQHLTRIRSGAIRQVQPHVVDMVRETYHRLGDTPCDEAGAAVTRAHARRHRWDGPDSWGDPDDPDELPNRLIAECHDHAYRLEAVVRTDEPSHTGRHPRLSTAEIDEIRVAYTAATVGTWDRRPVAARYGVRPDLVTKAVNGTIAAGYTDLTAALGRKQKPSGPARQVTDDVIYAVRADYLAGTPWSQLGPRHGVSKTLAARIVHGRIRPHLGLDDLTAHKRGDNTAATPTSRETGKESAA